MPGQPLAMFATELYIIHQLCKSLTIYQLHDKFYRYT
jgi:hypothetical protein